MDISRCVIICIVFSSYIVNEVFLRVIDHLAFQDQFLITSLISCRWSSLDHFIHIAVLSILCIGVICPVVISIIRSKNTVITGLLNTCRKVCISHCHFDGIFVITCHRNCHCIFVHATASAQTHRSNHGTHQDNCSKFLKSHGFLHL